MFWCVFDHESHLIGTFLYGIADFYGFKKLATAIKCFVLFFLKVVPCDPTPRS